MIFKSTIYLLFSFNAIFIKKHTYIHISKIYILNNFLKFFLDAIVDAVEIYTKFISLDAESSINLPSDARHKIEGEQLLLESLRSDAMVLYVIPKESKQKFI